MKSYVIMLFVTPLVNATSLTLASEEHGNCAIRNVNGGLLFTCNETESGGSASKIDALQAKVDQLVEINSEILQSNAELQANVSQILQSSAELRANVQTLLSHFGYVPPPSTTP